MISPCAFPSPARTIVRAAGLLPVVQIMGQMVPKENPSATVPLAADLTANRPRTQCGWRDAQQMGSFYEIQPPHQHVRINPQKPGERLHTAVWICFQICCHDVHPRSA